MHPDCTPHNQLPLSRKRRKKYGRNSTDEQHKAATIHSQVQAVDDWDRQHDGNPQPDDWYIDEGWSGFTLERPELDRLRDDARAPNRDWDELVIYDTSRLSREPFHRLHILQPELRALGITIHYVASPIYEDTADGRFMEWQQAGMDKWFAEKNKENLRRGLRQKVRDGSVWWAPYGYRIVRHAAPNGGRAAHTVEVIEEEKAIVQEIFARVLAGDTTTTIARDLNARGVLTQKGKRWRSETVGAIIRDPYYVGQAGYRKYEKVEPRKRRPDGPKLRRRPKSSARALPEQDWWGKSSVPAFVSVDEQERAKAQLTRNKRTASSHPTRLYLLRGLLRCKFPVHNQAEPCNHQMAARTRQRQSGTERSFYECNRRYFDVQPGERLTCCNRLERWSTEQLVWTKVVQALRQSDDLAAAFERLRMNPQRQRQQWQEAIERLATERDRLRAQLRQEQDRLNRGIYTEVDYQVARDDILPVLEQTEEDLRQAQHKLAQVRDVQVDYDKVERLCTEIARRADVAGPEQRAEILQSLLTNVDVYPDRLEIRGVLGDVTTERTDEGRHQLRSLRRW
jgi:site-specific DNA recombinase